MKLWTLSADRTKWMVNWTLSRSDSMGNVVDRLDCEKDGVLTLQDYPDDFLDSMADVFETYAYHVDEHEDYDNDDYDISSSTDREYIAELQQRDMIVISEGRPVGYMLQSTKYGGGMDSRTWTKGTILYFDQPGRGYTVYEQSGRWSYIRTYTIIKRK